MCDTSPFSIKAQNKINFHVAPSSDVTAATAAGDRSKSTCNEFSARGTRMERCAESGNAWPGVKPAHSIGSRQLQGSLHVLSLALHHMSASHAQQSRNAASARLTLVKHGLALVLSVHFHGLEPRDAVLELGARFIHTRTRIARDRLAKHVHNVTKCSGQWRCSGARRQKYTFSSGGGGGICRYSCRCFSSDGISTDMQ